MPSLIKYASKTKLENLIFFSDLKILNIGFLKKEIVLIFRYPSIGDASSKIVLIMYGLQSNMTRSQMIQEDLMLDQGYLI